MTTDAAAAEIGEVAERYARFARDEAPGRSPLYAEWAAGVAADAETALLLSRITAQHRQPPLVFAVSRLLGAPEEPFDRWRAWALAHGDALVAQAQRRSLQTNEPQRCAALLPAMADIEGPIALLELGASAGLCLYPDRWSYRYSGPGGVVSLDPEGGASPVVLECRIPVPLPPLRLPEIVWRAGVDLAPLNAADPEDRRFLTTLVWPGEHGRAERIGAALDVAASSPALLTAGDATDSALLTALADAAPPDATLVVTTPGLLPHLPRAGRERLSATIEGLDAVWVSLDPPWIHAQRHPGFATDGWTGFVLTRDGAALADADPLGAWVEWRAGDVAASR